MTAKAKTEGRNPAKQLSEISRWTCNKQGAPDAEKNLACDGKTVLVVDDDEICRSVTAEILGQLGMHVHLAPDAEQAINLARTNIYDLILLDLYMPVMNGAELAGILLEYGCATEDSTFLLTGEDQNRRKKTQDGLALRIVRKPLARAWIESFFPSKQPCRGPRILTLRKPRKSKDSTFPAPSRTSWDTKPHFSTSCASFPITGLNSSPSTHRI
jgi:CheY-like chemotaxis protein